MFRVIWSDRAFKDLDQIDTFLCEKSPQASANTILKILDRTRQMENFPLSGSPESLMPNHRYLVEGNYRIIYRIDGETVFVVRIFDSRQNPEKVSL